MKNWVHAWINLSTADTIGDSHSHVVCDTGTRVLEDPAPSHQPAEESTIPHSMMSYPRWQTKNTQYWKWTTHKTCNILTQLLAFSGFLGVSNLS